MLHAQEHAENIGLERRGIAFRGLVRDRATLAFRAGIVDRDIEAAKPRDGLVDQSAESYAATFDTNVLGVVLSMKHEVRVMQRQGSGSIINISSTYGHEGAAGASIYVGSKHAVEGITKSVALEIAKFGIRVNGVAPGPTDTGMLTRFTGTPENKAALVTSVPMGRLGLSEELANAIVFIASDDASFITGHILNVDGGHSAN